MRLRSPPRSRWSVRATKTFERSPVQLENLMADVITEAVGGRPVPVESGEWRVTLRRPLSVFDSSDITVKLSAGGEAMMSEIAVDVAFDASPEKIGMMMGLTTSIVGAPFGFAWRWGSAHRAEVEANRTIESLWRALDARLSASAYR